MTSEVLMLNKDAVVIAADSAVTTGRDPHPRYSKAANKIFDLSIHGNVAVTIYAAAEIDCVPWELTLKQFRQHDAPNAQRAKLEDYVEALIDYLQGNPKLFPPSVREGLLIRRLFTAAGTVLERVGALFPAFIDTTKTPLERTGAWAQGQVAIAAELAARNYQAPLAAADHQSLMAQAATLEAELGSTLAANRDYQHADASQLTALAIEALVKQPTDFLGYSGLVFAGYGAEEIFPSYVHIGIYGHIGDTLLWTESSRYAITHVNDALIMPFAQSSMIDRFTDGFDNKVRQNTHSGSYNCLWGVVSDLKCAGMAVPDAVIAPIVDKRHEEFLTNWQSKNWEHNFHPLRRVLNSLSVSEMGHLAESLLVLEELRERVTSPSESVGGPIDVAVVTKAEGLVWLKRKHFFDPELNSRYLARSKSDYN